MRWLDAAQPYYELPGKVDRYDAELAPLETLSTMKRPTSHQLIALMKRHGANSVLDLGCGAGAFYKVARAEIPGLRYHGVDASRAQVERATRNYGELFSHGDASALDATYFSTFDAVHVYSVFAFMSVDRQLRALKAIVDSGVLALLEIGATLPDPGFVPRCAFRNHGGLRMEGAAFLNAVAHPYAHEIAPIARLQWREGELGAPYACNASGRDGSALHHGAAPSFRRPRRLRMLTGLYQCG